MKVIETRETDVVVAIGTRSIGEEKIGTVRLVKSEGDGELVMEFLASEWERIEQQVRRLRANPNNTGAPLKCAIEGCGKIHTTVKEGVPVCDNHLKHSKAA